MIERYKWEPQYGFAATNNTPADELAAALEWIRRRICAYGGRRCDCKNGLGEHLRDGQPIGSEQTGCPELLEVIHRLLHRQPAEPSDVERRVLEQCDLIEADGEGKPIGMVARAIAEQFRAAVRGAS